MKEQREKIEELKRIYTGAEDKYLEEIDEMKY